MDKDEIRRMIQSYVKEICHYGQMQVFATSYYQSNFFQRQMDDVTDRLVSFCLDQQFSELREQQTGGQENEAPQPHAGQGIKTPGGGRTFTLEELSFYDGSSGRPAYVAVNDIVYDVTSLIKWAGGTHFGVYAGKDLTVPFTECHPGTQDVLKNLPKIGTLVK